MRRLSLKISNYIIAQRFNKLGKNQIFLQYRRAKNRYSATDQRSLPNIQVNERKENNRRGSHV